MKKKKSASKAKSSKKIASNSSSKSRAGTNEGDIIQLILKDHIPLKKLIKTLTDQEAEYSEKQEAFEEFAPLLLAHAKPEEESLYERLKSEDTEIRAEGFEGSTEHAIADQLIEEIKQTDDQDEWMAKVKVLGELVEHHIEEEEGEMFKMVRKEMDIETRVAIGEEYTRLREEFGEESEVESGSRSRKPKTEEEKFL